MRDKKNITLDIDSALALMQEIYNDVAENRNSATLIMKKMLSSMKDLTDMTVIGPIIKDQQKILNDCIQKKIYLSKLQSTLIKESGNISASDRSNSFSVVSLSDEDRKILDQLMEETDKQNDDDTYKINE
jgi:hypothetical protein